MLLGRGVVAAADELLLAWLDNESDVSREDVVELVMAFFDAVADRVGDRTLRTSGSTRPLCTTLSHNGFSAARTRF
jgi:hypothetical protein